MKRRISLLTMGSGNIIALKKTMDSFAHIVDEFVYGDLLLFETDRQMLYTYQQEYNIKIVKFPFDFLFHNGFAPLLNRLSENSSNDLCIYMNTSEAIQTDNGILDIVAANPECNAFYFDHETDKHRWYRFYDRRDLHWEGVIHEELHGEFRPYHKPVFRMMDLDKDMHDPFKAKIFDDLKELVYFNQYLKLIDDPEAAKWSNSGWIKFATDGYKSFQDRLMAKGKRWAALSVGSYEAYMNDCFSNPEFESQRFKSFQGIEFQNDPMYLNKK